jgi:hypothetical protein
VASLGRHESIENGFAVAALLTDELTMTVQLDIIKSS